MTEKLNRRHVYQTYGYRFKSNIFYLYGKSSRCRCYQCKFNISCPYSYMRVYLDREGHYIKCLRFVPKEEPSDKNVSLYTIDSKHYLYIYFKEGRVYD